MSILYQYDIGVKSFKLLKTDTVLNVWCKGRHLNINPEDSTFCYEPKILSITNVTIQKLIDVMSIVNLDDYYQTEFNRKVYYDIKTVAN